LTKKFLNQVNYKADVNTIQKSFQEFMNHPVMRELNKITVQDAQKLKQGTYQRLKDKAYGEVGTADTEAQKTWARALKENIAEKIPDIEPLNARESELINALSVSEKRALMDAVKNPSVLASMSKSPVMMAKFSLGHSAKYKSGLALLANKAAKSKTVTKLTDAQIKSIIRDDNGN
jgi:hypothetical protein